MKLVILIALATTLAATPLAAQSRVQEFATAFTKHKDVTKTRKGVTTRKFHQVRAEPWLASLSAYAGDYESDDIHLSIRFDTNRLSVTGVDDGRKFILMSPNIAKGMLTGVKRYSNGNEDPFEAAFLTRYDVAEPNGSEIVLSGIGLFGESLRYGVTPGQQRVFLVKK